MNSYLKISLAGITMLSCLSPTLVCAEQPHGFIDYRHEYLDDTRTHADRVEFGTFFSNGIGLMENYAITPMKVIKISGTPHNLAITEQDYLLFTALSRWMTKNSG